jgi:Cu(I)/Ag(I) efflux system membrane fusion protein
MKARTALWLAFGGGFAAGLALLAAWLAWQHWYRAGPPGAPAQAALPGAVPAAARGRAALQLSQRQTDAIDLRVAQVERASLADELRVVATVVPDESRISHIHTRTAGWIERLHVANTGEAVRAGQPIVDIYSQELYASQLEYLAVRGGGGPPTALLESARARLRFFGMSEEALAAIEGTGRAQRVVTLRAPLSGILAHRGVATGTAVDPSTEIAVIADLSQVWVLAEVPEHAAGAVRKGMPAQLAMGGGAAPVIGASVEFVDPRLSEATRALKVRFALPNRDGRLRPGMYGTAVFQLAPRQALAVPREAVVDTGGAQYVYVAREGGVYEPRPVRIGARVRDQVEVVDGLSEGERVVVAGVFLLDSESRLRGSGSPAGAHGAHAAGPAVPAPQAPAAHAHDGADGERR